MIFENPRLKPDWKYAPSNWAFVQIGRGEDKTGHSFQQEPTPGGRDL